MLALNRNQNNKLPFYLFLIKKKVKINLDNYILDNYIIKKKYGYRD